MNTLAWVLILGAFIILNAALKGRVGNLKEDMGDAFLALVNGDSTAFADVFKRDGDGNVPTFTSANTDTTSEEIPEGFIGPVSKQDLLVAAVRLGTAAKGYRFTATGPDYYDCSGLVWKAAKATGLYNGPRFTTYTIGAVKAFKKVTDPKVGDVVVWPTRHMGVVSGDDKFYSARSVKSGIGESKISTFRGTTPVYYRLTGE